METSNHLPLLVEHAYLRPYFYDNKAWVEGDRASSDRVKAMAELLLDNLASAIIHSAAFPQYPIRGVLGSISVTVPPVAISCSRRSIAFPWPGWLFSR